MATKIGGFDSGPAPASTGQVSKGASVKRAGNADSAAKSSSTDSTSDTHITDSAKKLAALEQSVRDLPAVDEARVQQVSERIAKGSYKIDAGRVADKLLRSEHDLAALEE